MSNTSDNPLFTDNSNKASGKELEQLIAPVTREDFLNNYFARESFTVKGTPDKFKNIFSQERLQRALALGQRIPDKRYNITATFSGGETEGSRRQAIPAYYDQISELHNAGATICITNIQMADPVLANWTQSVRAQLNFSGTVGVNCYISPDGSGLPMHYDKRIATSLQISGSKKWVYSTEAAQPWPLHNGRYVDGAFEIPHEQSGMLPSEMEFKEVVLNPGDLLCIPAGAWHSAKAIGDCMAINLFFAPRNFLDQLNPILQTFAMSNELWRGGPPPTQESANGTLPEVSANYIRDRLEEFSQLAQDLLSNPSSLTESWLNSQSVAPYTGWRPASKPASKPRSQNQKFRIESPSFHFVEYEGKVLVASDNGAIELPTYILPVLKEMAKQTATFSVQDILSWGAGENSLTMDQIIPCFQSLIENRVVEVLG
jgi:ribosomal protein L16 Arg81 hydroxylase